MRFINEIKEINIVFLRKILNYETSILIAIGV
jgi:hypothetical protein